MVEDLVSVIVPVYNVSEYLDECVQSIQKQTFSNLEIILVDDGSIDNSGEMVDQYAVHDKRIKVIHQKNMGLSAARNAGLDVMHGKWIVFVDGDDYITSDHIETLYELCQQYQASISQGCPNSMGEIDRIEEGVCTGREFMMNDLMLVMAWAKMYSCKHFKCNRYPVGKIHEDDGLTYRLIYEADKVAYTNKRIYLSHVRQDSILGQKFHLGRMDKLEFLKDKIEFFKSNGEKELMDKAEIEYANTLLQYYVLSKRNLDSYKEICKLILKEYRRVYSKLLTSHISWRKKLVYTLNYITPLEVRHGKR